jgi:hypothetical protein
VITCNISNHSEIKILKDVSSALIAWKNQEVEILPDHAEFFAAVEQGKLVITKGGSPQEFEINEAFVNFDRASNTLFVFS